MTVQFPETKDFPTAAIFLQLAKHNQSITDFYNDPMTDYCGCTDDFQEDFDRKERLLVGKLYRRAQQTKERHIFQFACDLLEKWMP